MTDVNIPINKINKTAAKTFLIPRQHQSSSDVTSLLPIHVKNLPKPIDRSQQGQRLLRLNASPIYIILCCGCIVAVRLFHYHRGFHRQNVNKTYTSPTRDKKTNTVEIIKKMCFCTITVCMWPFSCRTYRREATR